MAAEYCITHTQLVCARLEARVWPGDLQRGYFARNFRVLFFARCFGAALSAPLASRPRGLATHPTLPRREADCFAPVLRVLRPLSRSRSRLSRVSGLAQGSCVKFYILHFTLNFT